MHVVDYEVEVVFREGPFDGKEMGVELADGQAPRWLFVSLGTTASNLVHDYELVAYETCEDCGRCTLTYAYFGARVAERG